MKNKFNQEFTGFPFDKAHKYASEERIIQNYLMGDKSGIVRNYDRAAATTSNGLNITVDPFLAVIKGGWFRSHEPIVVPLLPNSSGVIVAQLNLAEYNDSVGIIDDGSYQYALNQVRVLDIGQKEPTREDILTSGLKYEIEICRYATNATVLSSWTDTREFADSKRSHMAMVGQVRAMMTKSAQITTSANTTGIYTLPAGGCGIRNGGSSIDLQVLDVHVEGTGPSFKITNRSKHPILVNHSLMVSVGGDTTTRAHKFNLSSRLCKKAPPSAVTNIQGTEYDKWEANGGQMVSLASSSVHLHGNSGFTNNVPLSMEGYVMRPGEVVYWFAVYGSDIASQKMTVEALLQAYELA